MKPEVILDLVRKASLFDIFIVSFFLLPFIASQWLDILDRLEWSRFGGMIVMLIAYVFGISLMFVGSNRTKRREVARDQIFGYLTRNEFEMMSFDRIREKINPTYDDAFIVALPTSFPDALRRATLKGGKPGIARIINAEIVSEG